MAFNSINAPWHGGFGFDDEAEAQELAIPGDLGVRVEWAVRCRDVHTHCKSQQEVLCTLLKNEVAEYEVPGVLRMMAALVTKILASHANVRASWQSYQPQLGNTKAARGHAQTKYVRRLGTKDNRRLVAHKPIVKGTFLGLYFGRNYWSAFEAEDLDETKHNALLTLEWYNCSIPLNTWLTGKRVVDAGVAGRGRSCWVACGNSAREEAPPVADGEEDTAEQNAYFDKDGRAYARRNIRAGEEIRFYYTLHESVEYQPPVPIAENKKAFERCKAIAQAQQKDRRKRKKEQAGGGNKSQAVATVVVAALATDEAY